MSAHEYYHGEMSYTIPPSPDAYYAESLTDRTGQILGYEKSGFPIHSVSTSGGVMGGYHFHPTSAVSDFESSLVCGGSSLVFIVVGLGLGWLLSERFIKYAIEKKG